MNRQASFFKEMGETMSGRYALVKYDIDALLNRESAESKRELVFAQAP
jgi:hypothetical protein